MTADDNYYYSDLLGQTFGSEDNCDSFHFQSQGEEKQATTYTQATIAVSEQIPQIFPRYFSKCQVNATL